MKYSFSNIKDGSPIMKSDFDLYCEKYDLRYCMMPDLNPNDEYAKQKLEEFKEIFFNGGREEEPVSKTM